MAHVTDLGFTLEELNAEIEKGNVRSQVHPEFPELRIYNYREEVQFKNNWNSITLQCRGLILNVRTGEVVARPWEKFFNLGQRDNRIASSAPVEVTDKLDGSLGILYIRPDGRPAIATRGSFASEQAIHANKVITEKYNSVVRSAKSETDEYTFLFEIVYPSNRIVVDYDGMDDLVLLGAVHKERGWYLGPQEAAGILSWTGPVTEVFHAKDFMDAISLPDRKGKEGYIIRSGRNIVKLKQADYVEIHRIVTNLSRRTIWSMLKQGKTVDDICAGIPDEFYDYVRDVADELRTEVSAIVMETKVIFFEIKWRLLLETREDTVSRRAWAEAIKGEKNSGLLFSLLDGRDIVPAVWDMVKPKAEA